LGVNDEKERIMSLTQRGIIYSLLFCTEGDFDEDRKKEEKRKEF